MDLAQRPHAIWDDRKAFVSFQGSCIEIFAKFQLFYQIQWFNLCFFSGVIFLLVSSAILCGLWTGLGVCR